jgi:hypothetical protein
MLFWLSFLVEKTHDYFLQGFFVVTTAMKPNTLTMGGAVNRYRSSGVVLLMAAAKHPLGAKNRPAAMDRRGL